MKALAPANQKLWPRLKFLKSRSNSKVKGSRSWYQMKGLTIRNTHVKYEIPSTYQSKVMTKVKVLLTDGQTDRQSDYYRAPAISGALIIEQTWHPEYCSKRPIDRWPHLPWNLRHFQGISVQRTVKYRRVSVWMCLADLLLCCQRGISAIFKSYKL